VVLSTKSNTVDIDTTRCSKNA